MDKIYCTKCNKCLTNDDGTTAAAYSFKTAMDEGVNLKDIMFMQHQMGKYKNLMDVNLCFSCLWDVLLGKDFMK